MGSVTLIKLFVYASCDFFIHTDIIIGNGYLSSMCLELHCGSSSRIISLSCSSKKNVSFSAFPLKRSRDLLMCTYNV